mmetsp:Transcript_158288/g.288658  ORF Transcript_158288/g.288658 Transcript_158288/m.288658 type:complete len:97 (+) Transcript_158288:1448-1738(+)
MDMTIFKAAAASRPAVGSSRKRSKGFLAIATAMLARRRCPPEHPGMNWFPSLVSWQLFNPIFSKRFSTKYFFFVSSLCEYKSTVIRNSSLGVRKGQ